MPTVAVTGARGFLGRWVVDELVRSGWQVARLGRGPDGTQVRLDQPETPPFEGVDALVHLAAKLVVGDNVAVGDYLDANVALTEQVVAGAAAAGATRVVLASSRLVYPGDLGRPATEADARPDNAYGLSKLLAEQVVGYHARRAGLVATALRISQVFGAGDVDRGVLAAFARSARSGEPIRVSGRGVAVRDYVEAAEVARVVRLALEHPAPSPVYNVGGGGRTIAELAQAAALAFGRPVTDVVHTDVADEDTSFWSLDSSLAERELGWRPARSLADALAARAAQA